MKVIIIGTTLRGIEAALQFAKSGYEITMLCNGTYLGEDITGTWKMYPKERQTELHAILNRIADCFGVPEFVPGDLSPGNVKQLLLYLIKQAGIQVCYMTRLFGAAVYRKKLMGVVAADKAGLFYLPCQIAMDTSLHYEATCLLWGKPLHFPKGHKLTVRMELVNVTCEVYPCMLDNLGAVLQKGIKDDRQAYLEAERHLPREMTMQEARSWMLHEMYSMLSRFHENSHTSEVLPADVIPAVLDLTELTDAPKEKLKGWYSSMPDLPIQITAVPDRYLKQLLVNGLFLPFTVGENQKVQVDLTQLPRKDTDLLVAGAGTAGIWAAISAARAGAKVCTVEMLPYPGGTVTVGGMNGLYYGNRNRLFLNMWKEIKDFTRNTLGHKASGTLRTFPVMDLLYYVMELERLGIAYFPNVLVCGAERDAGGNLCSILCCGEEGVSVLYAKRFIDATGDGDIAVLAGCRFDYGDDELHAMQNYSQFSRCTPERLGYRAVDQDVMDQTNRNEWRRAIEGNLSSLSDYDMYDILMVRETRRIKGRAIVTIQDAARGKRTPDLLYEAYCVYDPHGRCMNLAGRLGLMPAQGNPMFVSIPLGALLPQDINNLIVVGKAISMDQDAFNYIRMRPDIMCIGWIAGLLCKQSIETSIPVDSLPLESLQRQLLELGAITLAPPIQVAFTASPDRIAAEILSGEEKAFRDAVLTDWKEIEDRLISAYDLSCYSKAELYGKTMLWFGNTCGAKQLTELLARTNEHLGTTVYRDRQKAEGVIKAGCVGEIDNYWRINQLVILLSRAKYEPAIPVIRNVMCNTIAGSGWENNDSPYAAIRLDCQSIANYDRVLCLSEAAVFLPDSLFLGELVRIYQELEELKAPAASFYKEYLLLKLMKAMKACGAETANVYLKDMCGSCYSAISKYAKNLLVQNDKKVWEIDNYIDNLP